MSCVAVSLFNLATVSVSWILCPHINKNNRLLQTFALSLQIALTKLASAEERYLNPDKALHRWMSFLPSFDKTCILKFLYLPGALPVRCISWKLNLFFRNNDNTSAYECKRYHSFLCFHALIQLYYEHL